MKYFFCGGRKKNRGRFFHPFIQFFKLTFLNSVVFFSYISVLCMIEFVAQSVIDFDDFDYFF